MKSLLATLFILTSIPAYASGTVGNVCVSVGDPPITISQNDNGTITTSGEKPLYCHTDADGNVMCYY